MGATEFCEVPSQAIYTGVESGIAGQTFVIVLLGSRAGCLSR
jgi:hypothetical protein